MPIRQHFNEPSFVVAWILRSLSTYFFGHASSIHVFIEIYFVPTYEVGIPKQDNMLLLFFLIFNRKLYTINPMFLLFGMRLAPYNNLKLLGYYLLFLIVIQNDSLMESIFICFVYCF